MIGMECIEALLTRRSIRVFSEREVSLDLVLKAIDIARYAPSARNSQPWRFIVITDRELLDKLSRLHGGARPLANAKLAVLVLASEKESPTSYIVDASLAAMYLWLALHCMGLGAVWIQTLRDVESIRELLEIPSEYVPIGLLAIGYPSEKPHAKPRKPLEDIVYLNKFGIKLGNSGKT